MNIDLDVSIWNADFDHWMRRNVSIDFIEFVLAIRLASFAKVKVRTNGTFVTNAANASFDADAGNAVAMNITMFNLSNSHYLDLSGKMVVNRCELVTRMNFACLLDASVAKVIIATLEAFVSDTNNVLWLVEDKKISTCLQ